MEKNNYAFIDSQNLNLAILSLGWRIDFIRFRVYLKDKYKASKAFLFIGYVPGNEKLYTELQQAGYILIFKPTLIYKKNGNGIVKGNVDAELVLHTLIEIPNYEKAIIVTGDGDFYCLVEHLIKEKKLEKLIIPNKNKYSALLRKFIKNIDFLNQLEKKIGKQKKRH
jgi:uncharacterized LabA/DUF88 family protein